MILVTGAGGKTGQAVIRALAARGEAVRAFVRRPEQRAAVQALGAAEALAGDLHDVSALARAAAGVQAIYFVCPNVNPNEVGFGLAAIAAARAAGVERFVYHSVLHPQTEAMPHHWNKLRVEEALLESGLPFTILQPAPYMQNLRAGWEAIVSQGVYGVPYPVETRLSLVDLEDVGEAAATVLTGPGHTSATYEVVGTTGLSQLEVADILSRHLGRTVQAQVQSLEAWEDRARSVQLGEYQISNLLAMFRYYAQYGLTGNPNILTWLLGRPPGTLGAYVERVMAGRGRPAT